MMMVDLIIAFSLISKRCLFGYLNLKTLGHVASGIGGVEDMLAKAQVG